MANLHNNNNINSWHGNPSPSSSSTSSQELCVRAPLLRVGAGLSNLGNTCFLNSVLQCLTYTPPLAAYLETGQHTTICQEGGFCAMCALQEHIRQALASPGGVISPTYIVKNLRCISKSFRPWRQEDAHEYMRYLIESLDNSCTSAGRGERGVRGAGAQSSSSSSSSSPQHPSLIQQMFGGQLRSQVKCTVCSTCSNTYDPLLDLSLEIVRADSLTKALNRFTAVEALEGDNQYHCATCKQKVCALKQFTIDKSPIVLTIQFKRFSASGSSSGGKIDKKIDFGRTLAMRPYISNPEDSDANYSLYAVLVHAGWSTHSGHYYCFVRTSGGLWHNLDDSRVRQVSEKTVLEQKAYILFYIRDPPESAALSADPPSSSSPTTRSWLSDGANGDPDRIVGGVEEFPSSSSCTRPSDCGVYRNNNNNNNNSHAYLDGSRRDVGCSSAGRLSLLRPASKPAPGWRI